MFRFIRSRKLAYPLAALLCWSATFTGVTWADIVSTETLLSEVRRDNLRSQLDAALQRQDVQAQLAVYGVDPTQAAERVAALNDEEIHQLAENIEDMPAGGDVVLLLVVIILVLLLR